MFFNEISDLRILYFACSLFSVTIEDFSVIWIDFISSKFVTNVTIKDAPCEVSDQFIATHMSKYGQVINGSIKRGVIKGTTIENGTRYVQILNCAPIFPVRTNFGRFEIRLYADNNRTECSYCQQTNHPYYRCPTKPTSINACYNCNKQGHIAKYCKYDILCNHCGECGHIQRDCPAHKEETARKEYGDYFHEIIEGRNTRETFPSLLQLEAPSKTFTELLSSVVGFLSACPDVSLRSVSSSKLELSRVFLPSMIS
jgi:Zn ribbon nucleic-acid-binding protein